MPVYNEYLIASVAPLEQMLCASELGAFFTGELYITPEQRLDVLNMEILDGGPVALSPEQVGRLFMAADTSIVAIRNSAEQQDGTPAGVKVLSDNDFVQPGEPVTIIAYQDEEGPGVRVDSLYLARVMLDDDAPARFCTVAFGLMACTAYRLGFKKITLFAAGNGRGGLQLDDDDMVGYQVWPKFGFDAPLVPADLNANPELARCSSVLDVVDADPVWWETHGRGREMAFDLTPRSRSWTILLDYLYNLLVEGEL